MERKIKIPTKEQQRISQLEEELTLVKLEKESLADSLEMIFVDILPSLMGEL